MAFRRSGVRTPSAPPSFSAQDSVQRASPCFPAKGGECCFGALADFGLPERPAGLPQAEEAVARALHIGAVLKCPTTRASPFQRFLLASSGHPCDRTHMPNRALRKKTHRNRKEPDRYQARSNRLAEQPLNVIAVATPNQI